jgi:hypothetical protein
LTAHKPYPLATEKVRLKKDQCELIQKRIKAINLQLKNQSDAFSETQQLLRATQEERDKLVVEVMKIKSGGIVNNGREWNESMGLEMVLNNSKDFQYDGFGNARDSVDRDDELAELRSKLKESQDEW